MAGFFSEKELSEFGKTKVSKDGITRCNACGLYAKCRHPKMQYTGKGKKGILVVAEAPGEEEDRVGRQLVGEAGMTTKARMRQFDVELDDDCWKINAVNCRPTTKDGKNRPPTSKEVECCRPMVLKTICDLKPKLILLFGEKAVESVIGYRMKEKDEHSLTIGRWVNWSIPDQYEKCWIGINYHPSYVNRANGTTNGTAISNIFDQYLSSALKLAYKPFVDYGDEFTKIKRVGEDEAVRYLKTIDSWKDRAFSFDYETTGIKPHADGHRIVACSIGTSENYAFSFMVSERIKKYLKKVLENERLKKIAHNMKFENMWSKYILGAEVKGWILDTMLMAHVLDNRKHITGLKFQTYVQFGTIDYDSHISKQLGLKKEGGNSFNNIDKISQQEMLLYNGLDSMFTYRLAEVQARKYGNKELCKMLKRGEIL